MSLLYEKVFITDCAPYSFLCSKIGFLDAKKKCKSFGDNWKITRRTGGSAVCSTVSYLKNCHTCDSWRLLVWEDGACDRLLPSMCRSNSTITGNYYCGYDPCRTGSLTFGGVWSKDKLSLK